MHKNHDFGTYQGLSDMSDNPCRQYATQRSVSDAIPAGRESPAAEAQSVPETSGCTRTG